MHIYISYVEGISFQHQKISMFLDTAGQTNRITNLLHNVQNLIASEL